MLFVTGVRFLVPGEQDDAMLTRVMCVVALSAFVAGAKRNSFIERHLFVLGFLLSCVVLMHVMTVVWVNQGSTGYFFMGLMVMAALCAAAIDGRWIIAVVVSWTTGLFVAGVLSSTENRSWLEYALMTYPFAGFVFLVGNALLKAKIQLDHQQLWFDKAQSISKMVGWEYDHRLLKFSWSPLAEKLLGVEDLQGLELKDLASKHDWRRLNILVLRCLNYNEDFEITVKGGHDKVKFHWYSIRAGRAEGHRIVGVVTDVTEAVAKERELTRAKEAAETAAEARTRFLANMSHEIRTPMNGVIGMASLLLEGDLGSKERSYAEIIRNSGESLMTIINQILDFSKYDSGSVTLEEGEFDLEQVITEALDIVDHTAEQKGLKLHLDMPINGATSYIGDRSRLRQVLVNLLSNAVKFTHAGSVTLRMSEQYDHESEMTFEVIDTGIGITPAALPNLFDPFVQGDATTTRKFGGTGLGLAISREIVHAMGGEIDVYSHPKSGSKFRFTVPLKKGGEQTVPHLIKCLPNEYQLVTRDTNLVQVLSDRMNDVGGQLVCVGSAEDVSSQARTVFLDVAYVEPVSVEDFSANPDVTVVLLGPLERQSAYRHFRGMWLRMPILPSNILVALGLRAATEVTRVVVDNELEQFNHLRVLLAEDNAINQKVAQQMLKKLGCVADVAHNGRETIHMICEKEYDLIFMDVQMPEVDGLEATRLIRVNSDISQPYIVAMTANVMQEDRDVCRTAGMDDFVAKPVRLGEVSKALRRASNQINRV